MAGGPQHHHLAARDVALHVGADLCPGDDVLAALENQRASFDLGQVRAVVGQERHSSEFFRNRGIGPAEAVSRTESECRMLRLRESTI